jgi:hypothetical protein
VLHHVCSWHSADQVALLVRGPKPGNKRTLNVEGSCVVLVHALLIDSREDGSFYILVVTQIAPDLSDAKAGWKVISYNVLGLESTSGA